MPHAAALILAASDPSAEQQWLLWMLIAGCVVLVGVLCQVSGAVVAVLTYLNGRKDAKDAKALGGYVTHGTLLAELKSVYDKMGVEDARHFGAVAADVEEIKDAVKALRNGLQDVDRRHENLEGRLNPINPSPRHPRSRGLPL